MASFAMSEELKMLATKIHQEIDEEFDFMDGTLKKRNRDTYVSRPINWRCIVEEYNLNGVDSALNKFPNAFVNDKGMRVKESTYKMRLRRWKKDYINEKMSGKEKGHYVPLPAYGEEIDNSLAHECRQRLLQGLAVDSRLLRELLLVHLEKEGKLDLLRENQGRYTFTEGWAFRFFKRHRLK